MKIPAVKASANAGIELLENRVLFSRLWSIIDVQPHDESAVVNAAGPGDILVGVDGVTPFGAALWQVDRGGAVSSRFLGAADAGDFAEDINSTGSIVGGSWGSNTTHGVLWKRAKRGGYVRIDLGALSGPPDVFSDAKRIADSGVIAGAAYTPNSGEHPAVAWVSRDGSVTVINLVASDPDGKSGFSHANDVSSTGLIVGDREAKAGDESSSRATVWALGRHDRVDESFISSLGGAGNKATGVNASGMVVGTSATTKKRSDGQAAWMGFISNRNGSRRDVTTLGTLRHEEGSVANDINDSGIVVGSVSHWQVGIVGGQSIDRAVLWEPDGHGKFSIVPLDSLVPRHSGWTALSEAERINNDGTILGRGWKDGEFHAFLLIPSHRAPAALNQEPVAAALTISSAPVLPVIAPVMMLARRVDYSLFRQELPLL